MVVMRAEEVVRTEAARRWSLGREGRRERVGFGGVFLAWALIVPSGQNWWDDGRTILPDTFYTKRTPEIA